MRRTLLVLALCLVPVSAAAQVTIPNVFVAGTVADPDKVNANFTTLGALALNRGGGTLTGNLAANAGVTIDGIDIGAALCPSCAASFSTVSATTVSATTFSGSGASLTAIPAGQLTGTITSGTQDLITRLGTVTVGVWNSSTKIGLAFGGTNTDLSGTGGAGQVLRQSSVGGGITVSKLASTDLTDTAAIVLTSGSYADPGWISSYAASKLTGQASTATNYDITSAANVGVGETTLHTLTVPANTLGTNGHAIEIRSVGQFAANANNKTVKVKFGGTTVCQLGASGYSGNGWDLRITVARLTNTTQVAMGSGGIPGGVPAAICTFSTPGETLSGSVNVLITGQSDTAGGDVTARYTSVQVIK